MVDDDDARDAPRGGVPPGSDVPPGGWEAPAGERAADADPRLDLLTRLLREAFAFFPADLRGHMVEAARAVLAAIRALLDWLTARLCACAPHAASTEVRDIPVL